MTKTLDRHGFSYTLNRQERRRRAFSKNSRKVGHMSAGEVKQHLFRDRNAPAPKMYSPMQPTRRQRAMFRAERLGWLMNQSVRTFFCRILGHKTIPNSYSPDGKSWCTRCRTLA